MGKRVNKRELAEIFGISERTFTQYQKDASFPIAEVGGRGQANVYDTSDVFEWLQNRAVSGATVESAKERLDRIRGDREELALAKDVEELVPAASVQDRLVQVVLAIRTEMLNGGSKLKTELDALYEIDCDIEVINEHNRSILRHLASLGRQSDVGDSGSIGEIRASTEDAVG